MQDLVKRLELPIRISGAIPFRDHLLLALKFHFWLKPCDLACLKRPLESHCPQPVGKLLQGADVRQRETPLVQQGLALLEFLPEAVQFHEDSKNSLIGNHHRGFFTESVF